MCGHGTTGSALQLRWRRGVACEASSQQRLPRPSTRWALVMKCPCLANDLSVMRPAPTTARATWVLARVAKVTHSTSAHCSNCLPNCTYQSNPCLPVPARAWLCDRRRRLSAWWRSWRSPTRPLTRTWQPRCASGPLVGSCCHCYRLVIYVAGSWTLHRCMPVLSAQCRDSVCAACVLQAEAEKAKKAKKKAKASPKVQDGCRVLANSFIWSLSS